jgi:hypothetical protein
MRTVSLLVTLLLAAPPAAARQLPATSPESAGLSSARLQRLDKTMQEIVDTHRAAGIVTILVREGKVGKARTWMGRGCAFQAAQGSCRPRRTTRG